MIKNYEKKEREANTYNIQSLKIECEKSMIEFFFY